MSTHMPFSCLTFFLLLLIAFNGHSSELKKDAMDGYPYAQYLYSLELIDRNDKSGLEILRIASIQGNIKAINLLVSLNEAPSEFIDYKVSIVNACENILSNNELSDDQKKDLRKAGNAGDVTTQYCMWIYYVNNLGIQKPEAYTWLKQAAGNKQPGALMSLGLLYLYGYIVPEEQPRAIALIQEAKDSNFIFADILIKK